MKRRRARPRPVQRRPSDPSSSPAAARGEREVDEEVGFGAAARTRLQRVPHWAQPNATGTSAPRGQREEAASSSRKGGATSVRPE